MRAAVAAIGLAVGVAGTPVRGGQHEAHLRTRVAASLEASAAAFDGVAGYAVLDLTSGERFDRLADEPFPAASTIKIAILYELVRQADEKRIALDDPRPLAPEDRVGGSGILQELRSPVLSVRDLATLMMVVSDNTAANAVISAVGMEAINTRMRALGLPSIALRRRMMDAAAARRGDENVASPADLVRLLQALERGDGLSPAARDLALGIMSRPLSSALRRAVPAGVRVASKPGGLEGVVADAGIVYVDRRPFAIAVMTTFGADTASAEQTVTAIAKTAVGYFTRLARAGTAGRLF
jgi:beta-lactamase class A